MYRCKAVFFIQGGIFLRKKERIEKSLLQVKGQRRVGIGKKYDRMDGTTQGMAYCRKTTEREDREWRDASLTRNY